MGQRHGLVGATDVFRVALPVAGPSAPEKQTIKAKYRNKRGIMSLGESVFSETSRADWAQMVERLLRGDDPATLDRLDEDGLPVRAFYDIEPKGDEGGVRPRALPRNPQNWLSHGWDICQPLILPNADMVAIRAVNASMLAALETGATSIWLTIDESLAEDAIPAALPVLFDRVILSAIGVTIDAGRNSDAWCRALLGHAADKICDAGCDIRLVHGADDVAGLAAGRAAASVDGVSSAFLVDGWTWHNHGLSDVAELGVALAGVAEILRAGHADGDDLASLVEKTAITIALPADMFAGMVKMRAMRQLVANLTAALDMDQCHQPRLIGRPSLRMASLLDPDENMLRNTTALLGGAMGGADCMAAFGHDYLAGESEKARRLARMTQLMMINESNLASSLDPAAGSPFIEQRTEQLASAAWAKFQTIEANGGLVSFAGQGGIDDLAAAGHAARLDALRNGRLQMVGVNLQPTSQSPLPEASTGVAPGIDRIARPAALVETLRRQVAAHPRRILLLQAANPDREQTETERRLRRLLAIAGLQAVSLPLNDEAAQAIETARPDLVITLVENDLAARKAAQGEWLDAACLLADQDQIGVLQILAGGMAA